MSANKCEKCEAQLLYKNHVSGGAYSYYWECGSIADPFINIEGFKQSIKCRITELEKEVARLKRGEFTPAELQDLCHHLPESDYKAFCDGCTAYQQKLFGRSREDDIEDCYSEKLAGEDA